MSSGREALFCLNFLWSSQMFALKLAQLEMENCNIVVEPISMPFVSVCILPEICHTPQTPNAFCFGWFALGHCNGVVKLRFFFLGHCNDIIQ
jgi:hypothetical protein